MAWSGKFTGRWFHDRSVRAHSKADGISQLQVQFAPRRLAAGIPLG